jgi:hypothetical protein
MTEILLITFALVCFGLLGWGMRQKGRCYEFPFLAGGTFTSFVLPQLIGLRHNANLPPGGLDKTIIMSSLCAAMCYCGYRWRNQPWQSFSWQFNQRKLITASAVLVVIGAYFFFAISRLPEEVREISTWSGLPVAYLFFAQILSYGFALALLLFATTRSKLALAIGMCAAVFYLDRIFLAGRRGVALEFMFVILLCFWFGRRLALPRGVMLAALVIGTLALHSTGDYRAAANNREDSRWDLIKNIAFLENLERQFNQGGAEMENAVYTIAAVDENTQFDYGAFHWNTLVFNYVPAQLFGPEFKNSLTLPLAEVDTYMMYGHTPSPGSTFSGMVDAFGSFGYFGCLKFFLIGFILRRLYSAAMAGHLVPQLLYMLIITDALHAITHHTQWFVSPWVHISLFLFPALYLARRARASEPAWAPVPAAANPCVRALTPAEIHS